MQLGYTVMAILHDNEGGSVWLVGVHGAEHLLMPVGSLLFPDPGKS